MNLRHRRTVDLEQSEHATPIADEQEVIERFGLDPSRTTETMTTPDRPQLYGEYDFDNDVCPICSSAAIEQPANRPCVDHDFPPNVYFSLSLILGSGSLKDTLSPTLEASGDPSNYSKDDKEMIKQLMEYAAELADQAKVAEDTLDILRDLLVGYTLEGMKEVMAISKERHQQQVQQTQSDGHRLPLHLPRELKFISSCLNDVSKETFEMISNQAIREIPIDLQKIVFTDIRYARLLPLLCIIYESRIPSLSGYRQPTGVDFLGRVEKDEEKQPASALGPEQNDPESDIIILSSSDADNRPMCIDDFDPFILSSGVRSPSFTSPSFYSQPRHSSFFASVTKTTRSQPSELSTPFSSQLEQSIQISSEEEETHDDGKEATKTLEAAAAAAVGLEKEEEEEEKEDDDEEEQENDTYTANMPDYEILSTPELKAKLKSYGFKTSNNRTQMIEELKRIYMSVQRKKQRKAKGKKAQSDEKLIKTAKADDIAEIARSKGGKRVRQQSVDQQQLQHEEFEEDEEVIDLVGVSNSDSGKNAEGTSNLNPGVREEIVRHLKASDDIYNKILMYQPVSVEECQVGLKCKKKECKAVLDEVAAAKGSGTFHVKKKQKTTASSSTLIP